jgi:hypothetical protein
LIFGWGPILFNAILMLTIAPQFEELMNVVRETLEFFLGA